METIGKMETKAIMEIFELFKNDDTYHYKIEPNAPIVFGDDFCELSVLVGYEKTIHYITIPTHVFLKYGNDMLVEDGIYKEAKYAGVLGSDIFDEDQAEEITSDYGSGYYYTQMGLKYDEKFQMSEYIIDRLFGDLFSEYKYSLNEN
jgi:hypothetical protein